MHNVVKLIEIDFSQGLWDLQLSGINFHFTSLQTSYFPPLVSPQIFPQRGIIKSLSCWGIVSVLQLYAHLTLVLFHLHHALQPFLYRFTAHQATASGLGKNNCKLMEESLHGEEIYSIGFNEKQLKHTFSVSIGTNMWNLKEKFEMLVGHPHTCSGI